MKIAGEILGVLGIIVNFLISQQRDRKKLLKVKLLSDLTWAIHYGLLTAFSGMAVTLVGAARETTFLLTDDKEKGRKYYFLGFAIIAVVTSALSMKDWFGLLPAIASLIAVFSYWQQSPRVTKILGLPISASMIVYDIVRLSYMGIANEIFTVISIVTTLILNRKKLNKSNKTAV